MSSLSVPGETLGHGRGNPPPTRPATAHLRELGAFLRARRAQLSPADVGLPGSARRRTPGLRREEVALLSGVSATWYTFLEQGCDAHPSEQVLGAIAAALRMTVDERAHLSALHALAAAPRSASSGQGVQPPDDEELSPEVASVPALVEPHPSYITGATTDVLAHNNAAADLFPGLLEAMPGQHPNLARWLFTDPTSRHVLVDWEAVAQSVLGRLRANAGRHPGSARFAALEGELRTASDEADTWWPRYDIATHRAGTKQVRHPTKGLLTYTHASFTTTDAPEHVLVIYRRTWTAPTTQNTTRDRSPDGRPPGDPG